MTVIIQRSDESEVEKEKEKEKDAASKRNFLCELPPEIQRHVASFLSYGDCIVFGRFTSKSLASILVPPTISISTQPRPHPKHHQIPFMVCLLEDNVLKFHHPLMSGFYRSQIPELSDAYIRFSNHGWLLVSTCNHDIFFFEPFSNVKIELPKMYDKWDRSAPLCFNSPPTSPDCFVISVDKDGTYYNIIKRGEKSWTGRSLHNMFVRSPGSSLLMVNGLCYRLGLDGCLGVFDPNSVKPYWNIYGNFKQLHNTICRCFLVKMNQRELLKVLEVREEKKIEISIFHIKRRTLRSCLSLENKMLFLGSGTCLLGSTDLRGMHNNIYLPRLYNDANIFYSLSVEKYLSFQGNYSSKNCFGDGKYFYDSVWIKPVSPSDTICGESFKW